MEFIRDRSAFESVGVAGQVGGGFFRAGFFVSDSAFTWAADVGSFDASFSLFSVESDGFLTFTSGFDSRADLTEC